VDAERRRPHSISISSNDDDNVDNDNQLSTATTATAVDIVRLTIAAEEGMAHSDDYHHHHRAGHPSRVAGGQQHLIRTRLRSNDTVHPLPRSMEIFRREIVLFMILAFTAMIVLTIMEDMIAGIQPPPEKRR
jgi:hypothetical protein